MIFENIYMNLGLLSSAVALVYMIFFARIQLKNRIRISIVLLRGLFVVAIVAAIFYKILTGVGNAPNLEIFNIWRNIPEFGYKAVWLQLFQNALPFAICGFLFPLGFNKLDKIFYSVLLGIFCAIVLGALKYLFGSFDIDEIWSAILGCVVGYCVLSIVIWILPKIKCFDAIKMPVTTHVFGVVIILLTYFACVGALVVDSSAKFVKLSLPQIEQSLPANLEVKAQIDDVERNIMTYITLESDPMVDVVKIAKAFEIVGTPVLEGANAKITDESGKKSVMAMSSGEWIYKDDEDQDITKEVPSDVQSFEIAKVYALKGVVPFFEAGKAEIDATIEKASDGTEKITKKLVYLGAKFEGREIEGACEIIVGIGAGGQVSSVEKLNSDFEQFKNVKTISAQSAIEKIKQGSVYHTLAGEAKYAEINEAVIGYWLEEVKGILQPVWVFYGKAIMQDETEQDFKIVYPAMKY